MARRRAVDMEGFLRRVRWGNVGMLALLAALVAAAVGAGAAPSRDGASPRGPDGGRGQRAWPRQHAARPLGGRARRRPDRGGGAGGRGGGEQLAADPPADRRVGAEVVGGQAGRMRLPVAPDVGPPTPASAEFTPDPGP